MKLPPYSIFPKICSESVILRQIKTGDLSDILEISFYDAKLALNVDEASEMLAKIDFDYQQGSTIHWGIAHPETNEIVGTVGYYRGFENGIGELGCVLKSSFRGYGFMTMAMKLAVEYGLNVIGLVKVIAITDKQNIKTVNLLNRVGFTQTSDGLNNNEVAFEFNEIKV